MWHSRFRVLLVYGGRCSSGSHHRPSGHTLAVSGPAAAFKEPGPAQLRRPRHPGEERQVGGHGRASTTRGPTAR